MPILITISIYSLILTIATLYKDQSGYYMVDDLDIILAGPVCWALMLLLAFMKLLGIKLKFKDRKYVKKNRGYIAKVVKKVIKNYLKHSHHDYNDYIDFTMMHCRTDNVNDVEGWDILLIKKARYEGLNRKFERLMFNQKEDTIEELKKYAIQVTKEIMEKDNLSKYAMGEIFDRKNPVYIIDRGEK